MAKLSVKPREARDSSRHERAKPTRKRAPANGDDERSTMSEAESSDARPRKVRSRKDEPENHTRLIGGRKGHVTY